MEADAYPGPSLIIAYSHCIAHGYDLALRRRAAEAGGRHRASGRSTASTRAGSRSGEPPLQLDSGAPQGAGRATTCATRPASAWSSKLDPARFKQLLASAAAAGRQQRFAVYEQLAALTVPQTPDAELQPRRSRAEARARRDEALNRRTTMDLSTTLPRLEAAAPAHARRLAAGRRPRHRAPARGRRRRGDRHALAVRGADHRASSWRPSSHTESHGESFAEALSLLPAPDGLPRSARTSTSSSSAASRRRCDVPVIASLNGTTAGGWLDYARLIEQAGADALELNVYYARHRPGERAPRRSSSRTVEHRARRASRRSASRSRSSSRRSTPRSPTSRAELDAGRRRRAGALQPLLPAGHRHRGARGAARRCTSRARRSCCCGCAGWRSSRRSVRRRRWPSPAACTPAATPSRRSWPAPTRCRWSRRCCSTARSTCATLREELAQLARGARVRLAAPDAGQHEPGALPRPAGLRARQLHAHAAELAGRASRPRDGHAPGGWPTPCRGAACRT